MNRIPRRWFTSILALLWLAGVVCLYYLSHKPISPSVALRLAQAIGQAACAFAILAVSGGLGAYLLPEPELSPLVRLGLQTALGLGIASIAVLIAGAAGMVSPAAAWAALIFSGLFLRRYVLRWLASWRSLPGLWLQTGRLERAILLGVLLILCATGLTALAPPVKWDALTYHLALPNEYLLAGRVIYIPHSAYWGMPQAGEMLYTWAMTLAGMQSATILGWMVGVLAIAGLAGYVAERFGRRAALVSIASLLSGYTAAASLAWGYVDWLAFFFGWAFLVIFDLWRTQGKRKYLFVAGVFAGLALGTKYTSGVLLVAGLAGISWRSRGEGKVRKALTRAGQFLLLAAIVSSPWWIKNFAGTGNPFYPFLAPAGAMDRFRLDLYQNRPPWGGWMEAALLPLRATFSGIELAPGYSASIGPLLLGLGALAWMGWFSLPEQRKQTIRNAAWIAIPGLLVWAFAGRVSEYLIQSRLYFSIFPAFAVLAGAGWKALESRQVPGIRLGRVAGVLVLLVIWLEVFGVGLAAVRQGAVQELLGLRSREEYLADNLGWYAPAVQSIGGLPDGARVLMLWETRSLYCSPICVPDDLLDRWQHDVELYRLPASILQSWRDQGYTHVLYNRRGADFYRYEVEQGSAPNGARPDWQALDALFAGLTLNSNFGDTYLLYELVQ